MSHVIEVDCGGALVEKVDALHSYLGELFFLPFIFMEWACSHTMCNPVNTTLLGGFISLSSYDLLKIDRKNLCWVDQLLELLYLLLNGYFYRVKHSLAEESHLYLAWTGSTFVHPIFSSVLARLSRLDATFIGSVDGSLE